MTPFKTFIIDDQAPERIRNARVICRFTATDEIHWIVIGHRPYHRFTAGANFTDYVDSIYWKAYWNKIELDDIDAETLPAEDQDKIFSVWPFLHPLQRTNQYNPETFSQLELETYFRIIGEDNHGYQYEYPKYNPRRHDAWKHYEKLFHHAASNKLFQRYHYGD